MFTPLQSSSETTKASEILSSLKPWYFKPKKSIFQVDDDQGVRKRKKFNTSHWTEQENFRYAEFLANHISLVESNVPQKRRFHLNRMMSKHIKTRSPQQCRSHHQKILKSFKTISAIIQHFMIQKSHLVPKESDTEKPNREELMTKPQQEVRTGLFIQNVQDEIEPKSNQILVFSPLKSKYQDFQFAGDSMFYFDLHTFPFLEAQSL